MILAQAQLAFGVVVVDGGDAALEGGVIGDLDDDVEVDATLAMEVPDGDGADLGGLGEVDLHPVMAPGQFDFEAFFAALVLVGDVREIAGGGLAGRGGHGGTLGEIDGGGGHLRQLARGGRDRLEVVDLHRTRRAERDGLRQLERELLVLSQDEGGESEEAESEVLHGNKVKTTGKRTGFKTSGLPKCGRGDA